MSLMGRPKTIDDTEVLSAAMRAIGRVGPARLTLADVATEAGLSPATLVQRFGSKRGLLLEISARGARAAGEDLRNAAARQRSPLAALRSGLTTSAGSVDDPATFANHLAFLQLELSDPEFHRHVHDFSTAVREEIEALVVAAIAAGELEPTDAVRLAETIQTTYSGALLTWAIYRKGRLTTWLRRQLDAVLAPHLAG
jgi:AcrR family transcriptional regulator